MSISALISNQSSRSGIPALDRFLGTFPCRSTVQPIAHLTTTTLFRPLPIDVTPLVISSSISSDVYLALCGDPPDSPALKLCAHVSATLSAAACAPLAIPLPTVRPPSSAASEAKVRMRAGTRRKGRRRKARQARRAATAEVSRISSRRRNCQCRSWEALWATRIHTGGRRPAIQGLRIRTTHLQILDSSR